MIDNSEWMEIVEILEDYEDQELATSLFQELNAKNKELGDLLKNRDHTLSHGQWKTMADQLKTELDMLLEKIRTLAS